MVRVKSKPGAEAEAGDKRKAEDVQQESEAAAKMQKLRGDLDAAMAAAQEKMKRGDTSGLEAVLNIQNEIENLELEERIRVQKELRKKRKTEKRETNEDKWRELVEAKEARLGRKGVILVHGLDDDPEENEPKDDEDEEAHELRVGNLHSVAEYQDALKMAFLSEEAMKEWEIQHNTFSDLYQQYQMLGNEAEDDEEQSEGAREETAVCLKSMQSAITLGLKTIRETHPSKPELAFELFVSLLHATFTCPILPCEDRIFDDALTPEDLLEDLEKVWKLVSTQPNLEAESLAAASALLDMMRERLESAVGIEDAEDEEEEDAAREAASKK